MPKIPFILPPTIIQGVVVSKTPTYLRLFSEGTLYIAHVSENKLHYPIGAKLEFEARTHEGVPSAKITRVVSSRTEVTALLHLLYQQVDEEYLVYDLVDIVSIGKLPMFCRQHGVVYKGIIQLQGKTRYLFVKK